MGISAVDARCSPCRALRTDLFVDVELLEGLEGALVAGRPFLLFPHRNAPTVRTMKKRVGRNITGRDEFLLGEALTFAIEAFSKLPIELRPSNNIDDMKRLLEELVKNPEAPRHSVLPNGG
jgi:hypothetical protein